jgi:hypothetical protein
MPFSEGPEIMGFRIMYVSLLSLFSRSFARSLVSFTSSASVGTIYGGFDSPPRNIDVESSLFSRSFILIESRSNPGPAKCVRLAREYKIDLYIDVGSCQESRHCRLTV